MAKYMKEVVQRIQKIKGFYVGDIKAGIDTRYQINIGNFKDNVNYYYNPKQIKQDLIKLYNEKLLTKSEYEKIMKLVIDKPTMKPKEFHDLYMALRKYFIIRWKPEEIIKGYKILPGNKKILLKDAINQKSIVKIDMWAPFQGKYIEVTNFYIVYEFSSKTNPVDIINLPSDFFDTFQETLKRNIEELFQFDFIAKPFKVVKRMYALARVMKDFKVIDKILPLLRSDLGSLYEANSQIETIKNMLENIPKPPIEFLIKQIDNLKQKFSYISQLEPKEWNEDKYDTIVNVIVKNWKKMTKEQLIQTLEQISKDFSKIISEDTIKYLIAVNLLPPPRQYFPILLKYIVTNPKGARL